MSNQLKPEQTDEYWEEIFNSVTMDYLPLEYIKCIIVKFEDGKIWEIDIKQSKKESVDIEKTLDDFFQEFEEKITDVDFRLNTEALKKDIGRRTKRFLKLNK